MSFLSSERELYGEQRRYLVARFVVTWRGRVNMCLFCIVMWLALYAFSKRESSGIDLGTKNATSYGNCVYMSSAKAERTVFSSKSSDI